MNDNHFHYPLFEMDSIPKIDGYKLTAQLKDTEIRLFEEAPTIRLRVIKDVHGQWILYPKDVDVKINPDKFSGWFIGW